MNETQQNLELGETGADRFEALRRKSGLILAPVAFVGILAFPMESLSSEAHRLAAVLTLVIIFWVTEALPLAVTALLGPTLAVLLRVAPVGQAFAPMANPTIFLFLGSFILAQGLFVLTSGSLTACCHGRSLVGDRVGSLSRMVCWPPSCLLG